MKSYYTQVAEPDYTLEIGIKDNRVVSIDWGSWLFTSESENEGINKIVGFLNEAKEMINPSKPAFDKNWESLMKEKYLEWEKFLRSFDNVSPRVKELILRKMFNTK